MPNKTPKQVADEHLNDLRTRRRDVLDDYIRTAGVTDWVYTEEELATELGGDAEYLEAMRLVFEGLRSSGVTTPPPALR